MLGFDDAKILIAVIVNKCVDLELLLSTSNSNQLANASLLCKKLDLVFCEQKRTNEILAKAVDLFQRKYEVSQALSAQHFSKESDQLLELVLKQKQEIEEQFAKEFPQ